MSDAREDKALVEHEFDVLRGALSDLRREIEERLPRREAERSADPATPQADGFDWLALFEGVRARVATLGMREQSSAVDDFGLDANTLASSRALLDLLFDQYWRVEVVGSDLLPGSGPFLLVANHSGVLPYDGLMLAHALERERPELGRARFLVADWLVTLPFAQPLLARLGGVRACRENADRLLRGGHPVIAFPEGQKGAAKSFRERYQLQRFGRGGVVRAAIENRVPLVPVGIAGAEEVHPILYKSEAPARLLGLPFLPVTPTFPLFGALGLLPLPSKWVIRIGEPIRFDDVHAERVADDVQVSHWTEELRTSIKTLVGDALRHRESPWR